jgi:hypothetical protein
MTGRMALRRQLLSSARNVVTHCTKNVLGNVGSFLYRSFFLGLMILCVGRTTSVNSGNQLSCVWCRARWVVPGHGAASDAADVGARGQEGY